jgi:heme-degrading monooxygenase HmoA
MIARVWTARATADGARRYVDFFQGVLVPQLKGIEGHRGALVLTGPHSQSEVGITVITFWESMAAIGRFAGSTPEAAVVEPEARALLRSCDERVKHLEVAADTIRGAR